MSFASRSRAITALIVSFLIFSFANTALATNFAILLGGASGNSSANIKLGTGSQKPWMPQNIFFDFPASALTSEKELDVDTQPTLDASDPSPPTDSYVFSVKLVDVATGDLTTQFADPVTIGFDGDLPAGAIDADMCLGFFDDNNPLKHQWKLQDSALKTNSDNYLCGKTDHFTTFFFGLTSTVPEPVSLNVLLFAGAAMLRRRRALKA